MCAKKQEEIESSGAMNNIQNYPNGLFHQLITHHHHDDHHHQDPSQSETFGAPSNNTGSGFTIFSQDSVSPIWSTSAQPPFDQFPPPSFYGGFFNRNRVHHQEALVPVVQVGSGPFGLQAELGKMTAQEIMDAKALAASKSHSEAERRRRERINNHFAKLRSILPSTTKPISLAKRRAPYRASTNPSLISLAQTASSQSLDEPRRTLTSFSLAQTNISSLSSFPLLPFIGFVCSITPPSNPH
ncbi:unnamed protein product [Brassica oleracea]